MGSPHGAWTQRGVISAGSIMFSLMQIGCVANSSNPTVSFRSASMSEQGAAFSLSVQNPSGRDLVVTGMSYELSHGAIGFPLKSDTWTGSIELPAKSVGELLIEIDFDGSLIEPDSNALHLRGELQFIDQTGFLGMRSMDLTQTPFDIETIATRTEP